MGRWEVCDQRFGLSYYFGSVKGDDWGKAGITTKAETADSDIRAIETFNRKCYVFIVRPGSPRRAMV